MKRFLCFIAIFCLLNQSLAFAKEFPPLYEGFPPLRESKAYKKFARRTLSEFSKILYLIDRYSDSKILISYEDQIYTAPFVTTVSRWFLSRNYKKQTGTQWINQWCNTSIFQSKPIFVKLPDGKFVLAREILHEELANLDQVIQENQNLPVAPVESLTPSSSNPPAMDLPSSSPAPSAKASASPSAAVFNDAAGRKRAEVQEVLRTGSLDPAKSKV